MLYYRSIRTGERPVSRSTQFVRSNAPLYYGPKCGYSHPGAAAIRIKRMGITHVTTTIRNLTRRGKGYTAEFLVDTGAIDCMAPSESLRKAGVKPEGRRVYELANGETVEFEYGFARVSFIGAETVAQVIFDPEGCEPILGVVALENTGVVVDPKTRALRRLHASSLK